MTSKGLTILLALFSLAGCARLKPARTADQVGPSHPGTLTLAFTGDIMMGASALPKLKSEGPHSFFTHTAPILSKADLAVGNLEGPLGTVGKRRPKKKFTFLVPPEAALGLKEAGFDLLTLANNHAMDFGVPALSSTFEALDKSGIRYAGAGMNLEEARRPAVLEAQGRQVAFLSYSNTIPTDFWASSTRAGTAQAVESYIREDVAKAKAGGADLVVACFHWGQELKTVLRSYQPALAHAALDAGADAVIGHHPHIWQGLEVYKGKPIAYSLGNFVFGAYSAKCKESGILLLSFDGENRWAGGRILPLNVHNYQVQFNPQPMTEAGTGKFLNYLQKISKNKGVDLAPNGREILWTPPPPAPSGTLPAVQ